MKRAQSLAPEQFFMKEAKLEVEDDPEEFQFANGLEQKQIKEEAPDDSSLEHLLEQEHDKFPLSPVKTEPVEFVKKEAEPEPSALIWRPNIRSLLDFDEFDDSELDLGLGSSILFDNSFSERKSENQEEKRKGKVELINFDEEFDPNFREINEPFLPKKPNPSWKIKKMLNERFDRNRHPSAIEMVKLADECGVRYRTVFENFENFRAERKVKCEENDACHRIRSFFRRDCENLSYQRVTEQVRRVLEHEIETHLFSRKKFSLGYIHVIMEKTNLPPTYIRGQYESFKKKVLTKDREDYKTGDDFEDPNSLPLEILRKLEDSYLTKKYQSEEKEWSPKDFKSLASQLKIGEKTVKSWIEKRKNATLGLSDDVVELRKEKFEKMERRKLARPIREALDAEYERDERPSVARRVIIAKTLKITESQVANYFNKRRMRARRDGEWEAARQDVLRMPREKVRMLEELAMERKKSAAGYAEIAKRIGVKYMTLVSFVNWRKALMSTKLYDNY